MELEAGAETQRMTSDLCGHPSYHGIAANGSQKPAVPPPGVSWLVLVAASTASLSGLTLGYELGLTSTALLQLRGLLSLSCWEQELLVGSLLLGAFLISLVGGHLLDLYGRRNSMLLSAALVVGGTLVLVAATSLTALALGRLVVGMGTALTGTAACLYIAEIAPRERRGLLVTLYELMVVLGVLLGFGCSYLLSAAPQGWRYTFGLVIPPVLLQAGALLFLPPSPRFLVARGDAERARAVLARLRAGGANKEDVEAELRDIQAGLKEEAEHGFRELFSTKANLRARLLTGVALVFLQQATGQPNILSYASPFLRGVGFHSDAAATLASTGFGVVKVAGTIPAVLLVDRFGPKNFLCVGAVAMAMSLATLGTVTLQSHTHLTSLCQSHSSGLNHTHGGWDSLNHTHGGWDSLNHTHGGWDSLNHTHGGWDSLNHTHSGWDSLNHTRGGWDSLNHTRSGWDSLNHTRSGWDSLNRSSPDSDRNIDFLTTAFPSQWNGSGSGETKVAGSGVVVRTNGEDDGKGGTGSGRTMSPSLKWISLISLLVYVAAFSISLGPMVYVVISEIFPTGIRGKAMSLVSAVNWATNLVISMTFLTVTEKIGVPNVIFLYAAMSFILLVFVIFYVPETRGRTLEQISKELAKKKHFEVRFCPRVRPEESLISSQSTEASKRRSNRTQSRTESAMCLPGEGHRSLTDSQPGETHKSLTDSQSDRVL